MRIRFSFLRFGRKSRADPGLPVPNPDYICPLPPPNNGTQPDRPDRQTVLSQWRRLGSLDPNSHDYIELLRTLIDVESNRKVALKFTNNDAGIVINTIGEALRSGRLQRKLAHHAFIVLRKLAGKTGRLPNNYLVSKEADYQVEERIFACGGFADVRRGVLAMKAVAVKTIRVAQDSNTSKIRKEFCKESVLWMHTSHPNVLELIAVNIDPQTGALSMISELMVNGNVMDYVRVKEANRIRLLEDVTRGLRYLHRCGIVHGDLKGSNILVKNGSTPRACLSDFGFSTLIPTMSLVVTASVDEGKGTLSHMAPELHHPGKFGLRHGRVSKQADIYAFGIVVYEVLTGCPPFGKEGRRQAEIILRVMEGKKPSKPEKADEIGFGGGTWELVQQCWSQNRGERPTVEEVVKHFQRVAGTSVVVPPGPIMSVYEADRPTVSEPDSGAKEFTRLFGPPSRASTSIVQQVMLAADIMAGGSNLHSAFSVPSAQFIHAKPSLLERLVGARIMGRKREPLLSARACPSVRT